jgi:hypothetical protein
MASRIRTIKPDFFRHEELYEAEKETGLPLRVAFAGLFTVADREGRFKWKPNQIKFDVLPWDDIDFEQVMVALCDYGFIDRYTIDGKEYAWIPTFKNHQAINNREAQSNIPEPPKKSPLKDASFTRAHAASGEGKEGKGREGNTKVACEACAIFGKHYLLPDERLSLQANWFKTIDEQVADLLKVMGVDEAVKQIKAYIKHCKLTGRKSIGLNYKVAETILSANWVALNNPDQVPKAKQFEDAELNKELWTHEAWMEKYSNQIKNSEVFRNYFQITQ